MKVFKRIIQAILALILLVIVAALLFLNHVRNRAVPDYNAEIHLENLSGEVTVYRDSFAIPHIYADNELDLYRAVGYVMAQDRLWQMDLMRRMVSGHLAEILGDAVIGADKLFRTLNFQAKSEELIKITDPHRLALYEAYADGVNQYIEKIGNNLPFEFTLLGYEPEPWDVMFTLNMIGYLAWDLQSGWEEGIDLFKLSQVLDDTLFKELLPDLNLHTSLVHPEYKYEPPATEIIYNFQDGIDVIRQIGFQAFHGSNNWAISGEKSETGMPLMANDMHLKYMSPGVWYPMHHVAEGEMNVTGVLLPGIPFVICGHNEHIAWGMTNVTVDNVDFYLETLNPENENQYRLDGEWKDLKIREEEIKVKDAEPVILTIKSTHRGPIVSIIKGVDDAVISARWSGFEVNDELRSIYLLDKASNWDEFRDALSTFMVGNQNVVYADVNGNIGLQTAAGLPIRDGNPVLVYPGDTSASDWRGLVPFEELPYTYNPECGFVASANNRTVGDDYPYYIGTWFAKGYRHSRIREMLTEKEVLGKEDYKDMLSDQRSNFASEFMPVYLDVLQDITDGIYGEAVRILQDWDYEMGKESSAPMIFDVMYREMISVICGDEVDESHMNKLYYKIGINLIHRIKDRGTSPWCDDITTMETKESFEDNIRKAFINTIDTLAIQFGDNPEVWKWGDLHTITIAHPLGSVDIVSKLFKTNRGPYPIGGSYHTVCPYYTTPLNVSYGSEIGASERHIFNTADWDASETVIPTGISGVPASPYYLDQTELYINNMYHADHFTREAVEKNAKYKTVAKTK